jgi:hypothetical protein
MCDDRERESSKNFIVPVGSFFAEMCKQAAIKEGAFLVTLIKEADDEKQD